MKKLFSLGLSVILIIALLGSIFVPTFVILADTEEKYDGVFKYGGFEENTKWTVSNVGSSVKVTIVEGGANGSDLALKVARTKATAKDVTLKTATKTDALKDFDTSLKHCISFAFKTDGEFTGKAFITLKQKGKSITFADGSDRTYFIGKKIKDGTYESSEWGIAYTSAFNLTTDELEITVSINGTGTLFFDDFNIIVDPEEKNYIANGGFEEGAWSTWGSESASGGTKSTELVSDVTNNTLKAQKLTSSSDGSFFIVQGNKKAIDSKENYRLSLDLKLEDVEMDGFYVAILQWYKTPDGQDVNSWLLVYGSERFLKNSGTKDWETYSINLKGFQENLKSISLYLFLIGKGTVWADNVSLTVKEKTEVTAGTIGTDVEPGEVQPLDAVHLYTSDDESDIYYTLDGSDPRTSQTALLQDNASGIIITEDTHIRACSVGEETVSDVFDFNYTCAEPLIKDDEMWEHSSSSAQIVLDNTNYKVGNNSILLEGNGSNLYACTGSIGIDPLYDYKVEFWLKTEEMTDDKNAKVNLFLVSSIGGNDVAPCGERGAYFGNLDKLLTVKSGDDWTHYEFVIDEINGYYSGISLIAGIEYDFGKLWIDGLKVTAVQKQNRALSVSNDANVWGNNYYQSLLSNFEIEQSFLITSTAKVMETGKLSYKVYNDDTPDDILVQGDVNVTVMPGATTSETINLSSVAKYGTFTMDFEMTNSRGLTYPAGTLKLARVRDSSEVNHDSMFGTCINYNLIDFDSLDKVGVSTVRFDVNWENVETSEGVYQIDENMEKAIDRCNELGIDSMIILNSHLWPAWYEYEGESGFPKTDEQIEMFMGYVRYVVEYFGDRVKFYELFNETNYMPYSKVDGATYAKLLKIVSPVIKQFSPNSMVIAGAMAGVGDGKGVDLSYGVDMINAGAADYMDYMSFHPYILPHSPESVDFAGQIQDMQDMIKEKTGKEIPFIFTEIGWSAYAGKFGVTEEQKMNYILRAYAWSDSLGYVDRITMYRDASTDNKYYSESKWGIFHSTYSKESTATPMGVAMSNFVYMMDQYDFSEQVKLADNLYAFKYSGNESNSKKDMYMLWTDDISYIAEITILDKSGRLYDVYGNVYSTEYSGNSFKADVSGRPIYITVNKGAAITGVKLYNTDGTPVIEETETPKNTPTVSAPETSTDNSYEYVEEAPTETEEQEDSKVKTVKKTVKKVIKKGESGKKFNWIIIAAASVAVVAGGTVFFVIFMKKRKKKLSV